jgi:hypothetical protein
MGGIEWVLDGRGLVGVSKREMRESLLEIGSGGSFEDVVVLDNRCGELFFVVKRVALPRFFLFLSLALPRYIHPMLKY